MQSRWEIERCGGRYDSLALGSLKGLHIFLINITMVLIKSLYEEGKMARKCIL